MKKNKIVLYACYEWTQNGEHQCASLCDVHRQQVESQYDLSHFSCDDYGYQVPWCDFCRAGYPIYSTEAYRITSFGCDGLGQFHRSLIYDIAPGAQIFTSLAKSGAYIFFRGNEDLFSSAACSLYPWVQGEDRTSSLPMLEVRAKHASLNASPLAAFVYGNFAGMSVQDVELQLSGAIRFTPSGVIQQILNRRNMGQQL